MAGIRLEHAIRQCALFVPDSKEPQWLERRVGGWMRFTNFLIGNNVFCRSGENEDKLCLGVSCRGEMVVLPLPPWIHHEACVWALDWCRSKGNDLDFSEKLAHRRSVLPSLVNGVFGSFYPLSVFSVALHLAKTTPPESTDEIFCWPWGPTDTPPAASVWGTGDRRGSLNDPKMPTLALALAPQRHQSLRVRWIRIDVSLNDEDSGRECTMWLLLFHFILCKYDVVRRGVGLFSAYPTLSASIHSHVSFPFPIIGIYQHYLIYLPTPYWLCQFRNLETYIVFRGSRCPVFATSYWIVNIYLKTNKEKKENN